MNRAPLQEIAAALGINKGNTHKKALREEWPSESVPVRGGTRHEYPLATLPAKIRESVELHRARQSLDALAEGVQAWADAKRIPLTETRREDEAILAKLLCANAFEALATDPALAGQYTAQALTAALAGRLGRDHHTIDRYTAEAQGWLAQAQAEMPAPQAIVTADTRAEARYAEAFWRYQIIAPALQHKQKTGKARAQAIKAIIGTVHTRPNGKPMKINQATLYNWLDLYENHGGMEGLKPKQRDDKNEKRVTVSRSFDKGCTLPMGDLDNPTPGTQAQIAADITLYIRSGWASGVSGWNDLLIQSERHLRQLCREAGWEPPAGTKLLTRASVEAHRAHGIIATKANDAKAFFDKHLPRIKRTAAALKPMELIVGDMHPLDIGLDVPDGFKADGSPRYRRVYARLIAWHCVATNRVHVTMYFAAKGEGVRREHVAQAFCAMVAEWGIPERLYLDNGGEYKWDAFIASFLDLAKLTGKVRTEFLAVGKDRDIVAEAWESVEGREIVRARAYNAPAKPIEGLFSVLESTVFSMVPGWVGGDRMRKKTQNVGHEPAPFPGGEADLFRAVSDALAYYHRKPQLGGWLDGRSPVEQYARHIAEGWQMLTCHARDLMLSFAESYLPTADRGVVTINGVRYYDDAILPFTGQKIPVKVAKHDPGLAFVFDPKNSKLIASAPPERAYGFLDGDGAHEQQRRVKAMNRYVAQLAECCARLDLVDEMRKVAADGLPMPQAPVLARIELSPEAQAMREALERTEEQARQEPEKKTPKALLSPWAVNDEADPYLAGLTFNDADESAQP